MTSKHFFSLAILGLGLRLATQCALAQSTFTNLDFESPAFPPFSLGCIAMAASQVLPGWSTTPITSIYRNGPCMRPGGAEIDIIDAGYGYWSGAQGNYFVRLISGRASLGDTNLYSTGISQTGYVEPAMRSLHFRLGGDVQDLADLVSFGGQPIPCIVVSSNQSYLDCAADMSPFAGTTGELSFATYPLRGWMYLDNIAFSSDPLPGQTSSVPALSISMAGKSAIRLTFPSQVGTNYSIVASTNLSDWATLVSLQATNTTVELFDNQIGSWSQRMYRLRVGGGANKSPQRIAPVQPPAQR